MGGGAAASLGLTPSPATFAEVELDAGQQQLSVSVRNLGEVALTGLTATVTGSAFALGDAGSCLATLSVDAGCALPVLYTPSVGMQSGSLTVSSDAGASNTISLVGSAFSRARVTVIVSGQGGRVVSGDAGIDCDAGACSQWVRTGNQLDLRLRPALGFGFTSWGIACQDAGVPTCSVQVTGTLQATASFGRLNTMFVTRAQYPGNFGGAATAHQNCIAAAQDAGFPSPGNFVAWVGDITEPPANALAQRALGSRGWARPDGLPIADTLNDLLAGNFIYPPNQTEHRTSPSFDRVWTGLLPGGSIASNTCMNWTSNSAITGEIGFASSSGSKWTGGDNHLCLVNYSIYCVSVGSNARPIVDVPPLNSRRAFLSSPVAASLSNIAANFECVSQATAAGLPNANDFVVLRSTSTASGLSALNLDGGAWYRMDDARWATPAQLLANSGILSSPLDVQADGSKVPSAGVTYVWTGGSVRTTAASNTCSDWSDNSSGNGAMGNARSAGNEGSYSDDPFIPPAFSGIPCNSMARLYCVQN